ncbi:MAG: D-aminoacyl-tRNA deacylase [Phycisphaerales bacterium]|nr:D-aminoacyl-tRNA deacylase [Phycisphaerales bacterium]
MITVIQRVDEASVTVAAETYQAEIGTGLLILLGVAKGDQPEQAHWLANRIANLRVFADEQGRFNRNVTEAGGSVLVVSQFTLLGNCSKGHRPSFLEAADPDTGRTLYELFCQELTETHHLDVKRGIFQAAMSVSLVNNGPATFILSR